MPSQAKVYHKQTSCYEARDDGLFTQILSAFPSLHGVCLILLYHEDRIPVPRESTSHLPTMARLLAIGQ